MTNTHLMRAMRALLAEPLRPCELADRLGVSTKSAHRVLNDLQGLGIHLERRRDLGNYRVVRWRLRWDELIRALEDQTEPGDSGDSAAQTEQGSP